MRNYKNIKKKTQILLGKSNLLKKVINSNNLFFMVIKKGWKNIKIIINKYFSKN